MNTPSFTEKRIGRLLAKTVSRYLKDEEHRREFEEWYFKKYGVEYQWKFGKITGFEDTTEKNLKGKCEAMNTKYNIYRINRDRDAKGVYCCGSEVLKALVGEFSVDPSVYDMIYDGECSKIYSLDGIWLNHNIHRTGNDRPILPVSDVVEIRESESIEPGFYFIDAIGFKKISFDKTKCGKGES